MLKIKKHPLSAFTQILLHLSSYSITTAYFICSKSQLPLMSSQWCPFKFVVALTRKALGITAYRHLIKSLYEGWKAVLRQMFQRKIQKISHPLAFDWPTQKSTSVGLQIQRMENYDELLCISDQGSLHFHIPYNNTCTFLITADNQPGGIKRGIKSQKLFDLRGHTSSGLQTDAVGGEINEAIGSCSDGPRLYCAAFRSGAWLYYLNRRAGQKKKIVILWSETPQCCVRPLKWTPQAGGSEQVCGGSSRFHQSGGSSATSSPLTSLHSLCRLRRCAPYFSVAVQSSSN